MVKNFSGLIVDRVSFGGNGVMCQIFDPDGFKCSVTDMQRDLGDRNTNISNCFQNIGRKMQPGGRCRDRSAVFGKDGLVTFAVGIDRR